MIIAEIERRIVSLVGAPYKDGGRGSDGFDCFGFLRHAFGLAGIGLPADFTAAERLFREIDGPAGFADGVYFKDTLLAERHVGFMLDERWFVHCSRATNGVARSEITRAPWCQYEKRFFRLKNSLRLERSEAVELFEPSDPGSRLNYNHAS